MHQLSEPYAPEDNFARELAEANGFTEQELAANREGKIAPSQSGRLWAAALAPVRGALLTLLGWLFFLFIVETLIPAPLLLLITAAVGVKLSTAFTLITATTALAFLFKLFSSLGVILALVQDVMQGTADRIESRVTVSSDSEKQQGMGKLYGNSTDLYAYAIKDEYVPVGEAAYRVLRPFSGSSFRVFLTPRSRLLLSIEPTIVRRPAGW